MGRGIRTDGDGDPLVVWQSRLQWFGSAQLTADLRGLLGGALVVSQDGALEISALALATPGLHEITVVRVGAPYIAKLHVSPWAGGQDPDLRSSSPAPQQWQTVLSESEVRWEFFNCTFHLLRSARGG